jgi:hypothetical protein
MKSLISILFSIYNSVITFFKKIYEQNLIADLSQSNIVMENEPHKPEALVFTRQHAILTSRPENMSFPDYKKYLIAQKKWIQQRKKGFLVYRSSEIIDLPGDNKKQKGMRTYAPFIGEVAKLRPI